jgi:gamma-glutamyltranspeptidase/glutathione hydrolase
MAPAIRWASRGFRVTPYLSDAIGETAEDLSRDRSSRGASARAGSG